MLQLQPELERYRREGLELVIATANSPETMAAVMEKYNLEAVVLDDRDGALARLLGVRALPTGFLFDRSGNLLETKRGWHYERSLPEWKEKVEAALRGQAP